MREGRASRTAEYNALFRVLETLAPQQDRLFDDPLAAAFLSRDLRTVAWAARVPGVRGVVVRFIDRRWPGVRTSVVARTRLIDDTIATVLGDLDQVVILGAGFDTRPYRLRAMARKRPFEVDHPDTQHHKRNRLATSRVRVDHVRFVATDFEAGGLDAALAQSGFDASMSALIIWEGVTNYLSFDAVDTTLRWCAATAPGSYLVFTYVDRRVLEDPSHYRGAERHFASLRKTAEPMTFGLDPAQTTAFLAERGLRLDLDLGAIDYRRRYYGPRADRMVGHEFYRVAAARVIGRGPLGRSPR
jgi:methyltransferase (TIGR00027 family)